MVADETESKNCLSDSFTLSVSVVLVLVFVRAGENIITR